MNLQSNKILQLAHFSWNTTREIIDGHITAKKKKGTQETSVMIINLSGSKLTLFECF